MEGGAHRIGEEDVREIHLSKEGAAAKAYLDSELYPGVESHPALSGVETKAFDGLPEHPMITGDRYSSNSSLFSL